MRNDFFYFSKGQRNAVIILVILIAVLAGLTFGTNKHIQKSEPKEILIYRQEIKTFLQQLKTDSADNKNKARQSVPKKKTDTKTSQKTIQKNVSKKDSAYHIETVPRLNE